MGSSSAAAHVSKGQESLTIVEKCGCGNIYITALISKKHKITGLQVSFGKAGGCAAATTSTISGLVSLGLAHNVALKKMIDVLKGASCPYSNKAAGIPSCIDAISDALETIEADLLQKRSTSQEIQSVEKSQ